LSALFHQELKELRTQHCERNSPFFTLSIKDRNRYYRKGHISLEINLKNSLNGSERLEIHQVNLRVVVRKIKKNPDQ
jgi:hypothetical protein